MSINIEYVILCQKAPNSATIGGLTACYFLNLNWEESSKNVTLLWLVNWGKGVEHGSSLSACIL